MTPYSLTQYPNYEAHGLAIIALANRIFIWPASTIEHALITVTVVATAALVLVPRIRPPRLAVGATVLIAGFTLAWTVTTEVYAANGESTFSKKLYAILPKPRELARPDDAAAADGVPRAGDPRSQPDQPARVLESVAHRRLVAGRERAGARRDDDPEPRQAGRDADAAPHGLRRRDAGGGRRCTAGRPDGRRLHAVAPRREPQAADGADGNLSRRMDGRVRHVFPVRPPGGPERAASGRPVADAVVRGRRPEHRDGQRRDGRGLPVRRGDDRTGDGHRERRPPFVPDEELVLRRLRGPGERR